MKVLSRGIFFALVFTVIAMSACDRGSSSGRTGVLRRGLSGEPSTLDPLLSSDTFSNEVLGDLFEGLTTEAPTGGVAPGVASSWSVDSAGTEYTFQLRANARWSNGKLVKAGEFVTAWQRVVDPASGSPVADDFRVISGASLIIDGKAPPTTLGVYAPSETVLIVKLEQPTPYLPELLTHSAAFPSYSGGPTNTHGPEGWVSNGAYVLSSWAPGTKVQLDRNKYYWDRLNVQIDKIDFQIAEENSQFARYRAGDLDMTDTVPPNVITSLMMSQPKEVFVSPFLATAYYALNLSASPFRDNASLRQAVAMAIDRNKLVRTLAFGQPGAYSFVPPGTWNYSSQPWKWRGMTDPERIVEAQRLYTQAGYSKAKPLHLRLLFNSNPVIKNIAIVVAGMWKETLGIETTLIEEEYRVFLESRRDKSTWDVARLGWTADFNDASNFLDTLRAHSNNNDAGFEDSSFDALLDQAGRTSDPLERRQILQADEANMLSKYPIIPLYFYVSKRLVKPYVQGVTHNPMNRIYSKSLKLLAH